MTNSIKFYNVTDSEGNAVNETPMSKRMKNEGAKRALRKFDKDYKRFGLSSFATSSAISYAQGWGFDTDNPSSQVYFDEEKSQICFTLHGGKNHFRFAFISSILK